MSEETVIIIVDGGGAKAEAIAWLKAAVAAKRYTTDQTKKKDIKVFSLSEFLAWGNKILR